MELIPDPSEVRTGKEQAKLASPGGTCRTQGNDRGSGASMHLLASSCLIVRLFYYRFSYFGMSWDICEEDNSSACTVGGHHGRWKSKSW